MVEWNKQDNINGNWVNQDNQSLNPAIKNLPNVPIYRYPNTPIKNMSYFIKDAERTDNWVR